MAQAPSTSRVTLLATLALLAITASWGSTFFLIHDLLDRVPVLDFLAVRFTIASVAILLISPRAIGRLSPERRRQALVLGGESATSRMLLGGALVLAAMLIVELVPRRHIEGEVPHIAV